MLLTRAHSRIVLFVCSISWLFLLGCLWQYKWLTGKTCSEMRPGVEPATCWSEVQHAKHYATKRLSWKEHELFGCMGAGIINSRDIWILGLETDLVSIKDEVAVELWTLVSGNSNSANLITSKSHRCRFCNADISPILNVGIMLYAITLLNNFQCIEWQKYKDLC